MAKTHVCEATADDQLMNTLSAALLDYAFICLCDGQISDDNVQNRLVRGRNGDDGQWTCLVVAIAADITIRAVTGASIVVLVVICVFDVRSASVAKIVEPIAAWSTVELQREGC